MAKIKTSQAIDWLTRRELSLLVLDEGQPVFTSSKPGLTPLIDAVDSLDHLDGLTAVDKVVGGAAARIFVIYGIDQVLTNLISHPAKNILTSSTISFKAEQTVQQLSAPKQEGPCKLEKLSQEINNDEDFLKLVRDQVDHQY